MRFAAALNRRAQLPVIDQAAGKLRIAILDSGPRFRQARLFPPRRWAALEAFSPNILVGSCALLQKLVERVALQTIHFSALDHSIFVLTQVGDPALSTALRDRLWTCFYLPVYELYVDEHGHLLAFECEARDGWHVSEGICFAAGPQDLLLRRNQRLLRTGLDWVCADSPCDCGRAGGRIIPSRHVPGCVKLPQLVYR